MKCMKTMVLIRVCSLKILTGQKILIGNNGFVSKLLTFSQFFFSGACRDERLGMLGIKSVEPAPDTSCLRVTVFPLYNASQADPEEIMLLLKSAKNFLRKEVAAEISRRRVPDLTFRVIIEPENLL